MDTAPGMGPARQSDQKTRGDNLWPAKQTSKEELFMATAAMPTRDDFAALLNESLGGENEGFEGRVVKGTVTAIENDMAVIDVG
jgi:hypothetical protein